MKIKVGFGYDVHKLGEGEELWIGGLHVPHSKGSIGHSDGDVLIHAICDALLGAANLRDIGFHFPDTSSHYKGIDSKILLRRTVELIKEKGYEISNIDSSVCLEKPKLKDLIPEMQALLAKVMEIDPEDIAIKATTSEKLGFVGAQEGVTAYASVLIQKPCK
ncbi:2-C-methyl-D-erythritol 2,4-cyclodiphosphate synthase [Saccharicrinis carchari]|uniref:2-C-methyl-D-erythritol 2,4-cyclodiphosphate synthase n=1 Tax=Saccharicrinis carchari TaxID=1168039 RepID=A0A521F1N8_SACCC|nr:2-C-methyl-D-erythritol 2,4-cyclodiphosphate synthase [Saccharicrinis carchari]SMO90093.1 2-C-methyl-D-erythritol 2,4-cyclodiphosphate synthase [Saccharicrinis carchari]